MTAKPSMWFGFETLDPWEMKAKIGSKGDNRCSEDHLLL
jgi:hypothetical protein